MRDYLGSIEFMVVALFAIAWGILELVCKRLDRKKAEANQEKSGSSS